jgi:hypothetical protein
MLYNVNRGRGQPAKGPADFDPHATRADRRPPRASIKILRRFLAEG